MDENYDVQFPYEKYSNEIAGSVIPVVENAYSLGYIYNHELVSWYSSIFSLLSVNNLFFYSNK